MDQRLRGGMISDLAQDRVSHWATQEELPLLALTCRKPVALYDEHAEISHLYDENGHRIENSPQLPDNAICLAYLDKVHFMGVQSKVKPITGKREIAPGHEESHKPVEAKPDMPLAFENVDFDLNEFLSNKENCTKEQLLLLREHCHTSIVEKASANDDSSDINKIHSGYIKPDDLTVIPDLDSCMGIILKTEEGDLIATHVGLYDAAVAPDRDPEVFAKRLAEKTDYRAPSLDQAKDEVSALLKGKSVSDIYFIGQDVLNGSWSQRLLTNHFINAFKKPNNPKVSIHNKMEGSSTAYIHKGKLMITHFPKNSATAKIEKIDLYPPKA